MTTEGNTTDDLQGGRKIDHQLHCTCFESKPARHQLQKIQYTQNEALRFATGCHKMSSIDHLHTEAEILKVREHSELLSAQYLARCIEPGNVCYPITTRATPERQMKETLYTRHRNTVDPMMDEKDRKATLQALHTDAVDKAVKSHERNVVLDGRPPPISNSEKDLTRKERSTKIRILYTPGLLQEQNQEGCKP